METTSAPPRTRLKEILVDEGRRQRWLCERANQLLPEDEQMSEAALSLYVNGLHCPEDRRKAIAEVLNRSVDDVFPEEGR